MSQINEIPYGAYCYETIGFEGNTVETWRMKIKPCPFLVNDICTYLDVIIDDQVKVCDIHELEED